MWIFYEVVDWKKMAMMQSRWQKWMGNMMSQWQVTNFQRFAWCSESRFFYTMIR